ncbi:CmpA/NrtA family ABC transporter substrate-binding protein [Craurococcus roseus]|uniref:CmpA/NrtA family ABC transporter substrate-binding protein n=1 Tax=Craurococcus roseus TaxID=77585 RepID=A0ABP3PUT2_9PROT
MPPTSLLRIGYVALTDAAPLLAGDELGFFARQGLRVSLSEEGSWATVRDKVALGALDGAQMLGPMPIALASGLGGVSARLSVGAGIGCNGNTITLSSALADEAGVDGQGALAPDAFAAAVRARGVAGRPPVRLAAVFPFSSHNYLLRHWLALGGLDPDRDLTLAVVPPVRAVRALADGEVDGFCAGEPWGSHAAAIGAGRVALATGDIWPDHPEKVLAFREGLPREAAVALTATGIAAARWLDDPANRDDAVALMHARVFPALSRDTVRLAFEGRVPAAPGGATRLLSAPLRFRPATLARAEAAAWWLGQMRRWNHLPASVPAAEALAPYGDAIWRAAASLVGESEPDRVTLPEEIAA